MIEQAKVKRGQAQVNLDDIVEDVVNVIVKSLVEVEVLVFWSDNTKLMIIWTQVEIKVELGKKVWHFGG